MLSLTLSTFLIFINSFDALCILDHILFCILLKYPRHGSFQDQVFPSLAHKIYFTFLYDNLSSAAEAFHIHQDQVFMAILK